MSQKRLQKGYTAVLTVTTTLTCHRTPVILTLPFVCIAFHIHVIHLCEKLRSLLWYADPRHVSELVPAGTMHDIQCSCGPFNKGRCCNLASHGSRSFRCTNEMVMLHMYTASGVPHANSSKLERAAMCHYIILCKRCHALIHREQTVAMISLAVVSIGFPVQCLGSRNQATTVSEFAGTCRDSFPSLLLYSCACQRHTMICQRCCTSKLAHRGAQPRP